MLSVVFATFLSASSNARDQKARTIPSAPSPPIPDRLVDGDEVVVVTSPSDVSVLPSQERTPQTVLRQAVAGEFATTAIVDVLSVEPALNEDGTWIQTRFKTVVREVLRLGPEVPEGERVTNGQMIEFRFGGGEVSIKGVKVRAGQVVRFPTGRYLVMFAHKSGPDWWTLSDEPPFLLREQRLTVVPPSTSTLSGMKLSEVRAAIRRANRMR